MTSVKDEHDAKAPGPIEVTESGNTTEATDVLPLKAPLPIAVTGAPL